MKISVVLCTYNGEAFLVEQLDSIRLQTKSVAEVLIADDRSTDSTVHIIKEYIEKYPHIQKIQPNDWDMYA